MQKATLVLLAALFCATAHAQALLWGTTATYTTPIANPAGQAESFRYFAAATGLVTELAVFVDSTSQANTIYLGLYSGYGGHPVKLLGSTSFSPTATGTWYVVSLPTGIEVKQGAGYWLAVLGLGGESVVDGEAGCDSATSVQTDLTALPTEWADGTTSAFCLSGYGAGPHAVVLSWTASTTTTVDAYNIYRGTATGGPYALLASLGNVTTYTDTDVTNGSTYYYVATAVDTTAEESLYSNEAEATIP
jgi:hypothetical protein